MATHNIPLTWRSLLIHIPITILIILHRPTSPITTPRTTRRRIVTLNAQHLALLRPNHKRVDVGDLLGGVLAVEITAFGCFVLELYSDAGVYELGRWAQGLVHAGGFQSGVFIYFDGEGQPTAIAEVQAEVDVLALRLWIGVTIFTSFMS